MTHKERMLAAIRGEPTDQIPWAPRMDLWYLAHCARGTVPEQYADMRLEQLAEKMDVGCHVMGADRAIPRAPDDFALRAFGIDNLRDYPYRFEVRDLPFEFQDEDGQFKTTIHTPAGVVTTHSRVTRGMTADGIYVPFVDTFAITSPDDYEAVAQVFEHLEVIPKPQAYADFHDRIGETGVAVAYGMIGASPMHMLLHDLMPMEEFFLSYAEDPSALQQLAKRIEPLYEAVLEAVLLCDAEVVFWGCNYDEALTWPAFFQEEITPWLKRVGERLHAAGKCLLTHTDGENKGLLPYFAPTGMDVADSVCTTPMTKNSLAEVREGMGPTITIWGGLPSVIFLEDSMSQGDFEKYMDKLFEELGTGDQLILGVSDNVPPDANMDRLEQVKQWIKVFGPVHPSQQT